jgi:hypothetical protein
MLESAMSVNAFLRPQATLEKLKKDAKVLRLRQVHRPYTKVLFLGLFLDIQKKSLPVLRSERQKRQLQRSNETVTISVLSGSTENRCTILSSRQNACNPSAFLDPSADHPFLSHTLRSDERAKWEDKHQQEVDRTAHALNSRLVQIGVLVNLASSNPPAVAKRIYPILHRLRTSVRRPPLDRAGLPQRRKERAC